MKFNSACFARFTVLSMALMATFGQRAEAAGMPFRQLSCSSVISSDLRVLSEDENLKLVFESQGVGLKNVLRAILPSNIPDSLVRAYQCIELQLSMPKSQCEFSAAAPELFRCQKSAVEPGGIDFQLKARLSCYDDQADFYSGTAPQVLLESARVQNRSGFQFNGLIAPTAASPALVDFSPGAYEAREWVIDGVNQEPECTIDGLPMAP